MKSIVAILAVLVLLATCSFTPSHYIAYESAERPTVNLPKSLRQINWLGPKGSGSCAWASLVMELNWACEFERATKIRQTRGDGVSPKSFAQGLTSEGIPYVATAGQKNVEFLEQALASRRGVIVGVDFGNPHDKVQHAVLLTHLDATSACIIDNNNPSVDRWFTREAFLNEWYATGSIAFVPLYSPAPPLSQ